MSEFNHTRLVALLLPSIYAELEGPLYSPLIPNWNRVTSAVPDFSGKLHMVVEEENS